ncbi:tRNA threonylcarbamoyladenosine biosynthesis protein TsaE [Phytophthora citrophthora]|uniref:tRNA threonylcarbamoyladenosine biosynthesis protein TsaE n=1 Tax=Phytophthora citrophthora TaxID=4793 RepID=A0AAD9H0W3_9STRA|nr:tRNA threonylcarbamoyladenosine biosynthesis protein TsaE [Phytophthora citrophthora]
MMRNCTAMLRHGIYSRKYASVVTSRCTISKSIATATNGYLSRVHTVKSQQDMETLGEQLAKNRQPGDVLFLHGDLGCGKTCLARGFVREYTRHKELAVTSPTYLLVNTYDEAVELPPVYHVDLYRLDTVTEQDTVALGLAEAFERGITLVEWPERFDEESVPKERLNVKISYDEEDAEIRHVELQPVGEKWMKLFEEEA